MKYELSPKKWIRELDLKKVLIGKEIEVRIGNIVKRGFAIEDQNISTDLDLGGEHKEYFSSYVSKGQMDRLTGRKNEPNDVVKWKIKDAQFLVANNGGRTSRPTEARTYNEYFDDWQKDQLNTKTNAGILGAIMGARGDFDRADIKIEFENELTIEDSFWDMIAPEEWYTERVGGNSLFKFVDGFYPDARTAINVFSQKAKGDMFGERFFPVIVYDKETTTQEMIENICDIPKSSSMPVILESQIVIGTRCKPHEYQDVIEQCYKDGGKIPIGVEYSW